MPNIEICGFSALDSQELKEKIKGLLLGTPFEEMDVAVLPDIKQILKRHREPFITFFSSRPWEAKEILRILKRGLPDINIEHVKVSRLVYSK